MYAQLNILAGRFASQAGRIGVTFRLGVVFMAALALAACARSPHHGHPGGSSAPSSLNLQGMDQRRFMDNPYTHEFYDLSVTSLGPGAPPLNLEAYEQKAFDIFRRLGVAMGVGGPAMQDHLKLIPRQVVEIVREDPHALDSFDSFKDAMVGPQ